MPTVSVIIPAYNAAGCVGRAIESALAQTRPPLEIIVVDDGSVDGTAEVVAKYPAPTRLIRQQNGGPGAARNHGARKATGEWLALLDADDYWLPHKLERQFPYAGEERVGIVYSRKGDEYPNRPNLETLWQRNVIQSSSALIRKKAFDEVQGFDEDRALISVEDYNLWLRIAAKGWEIARCPETHHIYSPAPNNLSTQREKMARAELVNIGNIGQLIHLHPSKIKARRLAICREYARDMLYYRELTGARRLLLTQPSLETFGLLLTTCAPRALLDWRRSALHVRKSLRI